MIFAGILLHLWRLPGHAPALSLCARPSFCEGALRFLRSPSPGPFSNGPYGVDVPLLFRKGLCGEVEVLAYFVGLGFVVDEGCAGDVLYC